MKRLIEADIEADIDRTPYSDPAFAKSVITWQKSHGRHNLPWQHSRDAYRVWLSEIMLQQTQVATVIAFYNRFLARFPDVKSLSVASSEEVMALWSGLGYYTRARNLHACAKRVVEEYGGMFPHDPALLAELPGIGRSTAAAIAAFSYGARAAILDGNVKRVFARVFGIDGYPSAKSVEKALWERAAALLPDNDIESYTQGLMDLGATVCTRTRPRCQACPLQQRCVALAEDRVALLPVRAPKKTVPTRQVNMLVIVDQADNVLLEKRPESGIWGGLFSLPEVRHQPEKSRSELSTTLRGVVEEFGQPESISALVPISHGFTHFKLEISPFQCRVKKSGHTVSEATHVWYPLKKYAAAPLPAPIKKLLGNLADNLGSD